MRTRQFHSSVVLHKCPVMMVVEISKNELGYEMIFNIIQSDQAQHTGLDLKDPNMILWSAGLLQGTGVCRTGAQGTPQQLCQLHSSVAPCKTGGEDRQRGRGGRATHMAWEAVRGAGPSQSPETRNPPAAGEDTYL